MNILKKLISWLFKLSLIVIGLSLVFLGIYAINDYFSSDEYKYKALIGKTFPIKNNLSSLVDIGDSSLKVLDNGDVSIKFKMIPTEGKVFESAQGNTLNFSLRDVDGYEINTFSLDAFTRTTDANDQIVRLSYIGVFDINSYKLSTTQKSLILTDSIVLYSYIGLELLEPYEVRQAALEEERKKAIEAAEKKRSIDEKSAEQKRRDKLYADTQKLLSESKKGPSLSIYKKMGFDAKMAYENKHIGNIKIGMTYKEMVKSMGDITPRDSWNQWQGYLKNEKFFKKAKEYREAYRYGNYIVYFYQSTVEAIVYEKL